VQAGPGKKFSRPHFNRKMWAWGHVSVIPAMAESINRRVVFFASLGKKQNPMSKITRAKRAEDMAQMIAYLPAK
jgi:5-enolpyruvylshikimate-3-phosphate synthase